MIASESQIPVIDIFAGPGGLGEGFAAYRPKGLKVFKSLLSIEKDESAHRTLTLRSFFRQFPHRKAPQAYYDYLAGCISIDELYDKYPSEAGRAASEAWRHTLDLKTVDEVRERLNRVIYPHDQWVLLGGPPCQPFSLAGRSRNAAGSKTQYSDGKETRHELYLEYLQIIADFSPAVFVMENVKGLLSANYNGVRMFDRIIEDLQRPDVAIRKAGRTIMSGSPRGVEYSLHAIGASSEARMFHEPDFLVRMEQHGIPQARHRVVVVGVRKDLDETPDHLEVRPYIPARDVLSGIPKVRSGTTPPSKDSYESWSGQLADAVNSSWLKQLMCEDRAVYSEINKTIQNLACPKAGRGDEFLTGAKPPAYRPRWYVDKRIPGAGFCNHVTRCHMTSDLHRYLFVSTFAKVHKRSPKLMDFPKSLLPDHKNAKHPDKLKKFTDRFRAQFFDRPSNTVVSHLSHDGHAFIHPDPRQCRCLTVREAARLQTFPDNYHFVGSLGKQYHQVGNAVPPLLANQIARIVHKVVVQSGLPV